MIYFDFFGKLKLIPESDKFKPFEEKRFPSGWTRLQFMFNGVEGDNRHMMTISGGYFPDNPSYTIKTFSQPVQDDEGSKGKGQMIEIKWADRLKPENVAKVAEFRKFIIDCEVPGRRTKLQHLVDRIHDGTGVTDADLAEVGLSDISEVESAFKDSSKFRKEFISEWDYADFLHKLISSGKYDDKVFHVKGVIEKQYSDMKQQWYTTLKPNRIYLANPDSEERCVGSAVLFFTDDAVDSNSLEEKGKYFVTAYTFEYDSTRKKNIPCEFQLVIPDKVPHSDGIEDGLDAARAKGAAKKFTVSDGKVYEYGVEFDMLNGSQKVEITPDMLSDEQREDLELGLISMDDIRAELGGSVYGDRVIENRYRKIMKGYTKGRKETVYEPENLIIPPLEEEKLPFETADSDDDDDLFT